MYIDHTTTSHLARLGLASRAARFGWCGVDFGDVGGGGRSGWHLGGCSSDMLGLVFAAGANIVAELVAAVMVVVVVVAVVVMLHGRAVGTLDRIFRMRHRVGQ